METQRDRAEALLLDREARGLKFPVVLRLVLLCFVAVLFLTPAVPLPARIATAPIVLLSLAANIYSLRLIAQRRHLRRVGFVGVGIDALFMTSVAINMLTSDVAILASPGLISKTHFPMVCVAFIVINAIGTRPAYPMLATIAALLNYGAVLVLAMRSSSSQWTLDISEIVTTSAVGAQTFGVIILLTAVVGFALSYFLYAVRRAVIQAAELEAAHAHSVQKQAEVVMDAKLDAVVKLVAGVSHEVNTPLGAVRSGIATQRKAAEKLRKMADADASRRHLRLLEALERSCDDNDLALTRIADVVSNLEAFARVDEALLKEANVCDLLKTTLTLVPADVRGDIRTETHYDAVPDITCHPASLSQTFLTVLTNAFEAIGSKGVVRISVTATGDELCAEIADDGSGIAADHLEHLFDVKFGRTDTRVSAGFGLPICHSVVTQHRGRIDVQSRVGEGTQFRIFLPLDDQAST